VVAEESGGAHFGFGGAMLLDLPGPALRGSANRPQRYAHDAHDDHGRRQTR
jgi:hypothetical protein